MTMTTFDRISPASPPAKGTVPFLGLDIADVTLGEAAARTALLARGARFTYVVTPNAPHFVRLEADPDRLGAIYRAAGLILLDSRFMARVAQAMGLTPPQVVTGSDLAAELLARHVAPESRVAIIGGAPETIARVVRRYGLVSVAHYDPPMGFIRNPQEVAKVVAFVEAAQADFTFLCVGSPQQEVLAAGIAKGGRARGVGLCLGASLLFLSGDLERAPVFLQKAGLEWLYRLMKEPRRLAHRYLVESPRVFALLWRARQARG